MKNEQPGLYASNWDLDAISELSYYLPKRTMIGEYHIKSLQENQTDEEAEKLNFICIGEAAKLLNKSLPEEIYEKIKDVTTEEKSKFGEGYNVIHKHKVGSLKSRTDKKCIYKGFECLDKKGEEIFTPHAQTTCRDCSYPTKKQKFLDCYQYVLSLVFVDQEQRKNYFGNQDNNKKEQEFLLCELQAVARKKLMDVLLIRLQEKMEQMSLKTQETGKEIRDLQQKQIYINLVKYAVSSYLSTILYQYFFRFYQKKILSVYIME